MTDSSYYQEDDDSLNGWEQAEQRVLEAYEFYESGQMEEALDKLHEAVVLNPQSGCSYFNMGLTLDAMERYEEALVCYQHALELSGNDVEIMNCLAVDFTRTVQYEKALETFEQIETIDPGFEPAYCNRIITYTEMDQHDKAEQMFYLAQQINPECPICFYNIGNSLFTRGHYVRAIWCWEKTAEIEPTHPQIYYRIAQACWADGQHKRAKDYFLRELRKNPGNIEVLLDYGVFLLETHQTQQAQEKFNWILDLRPDYAPAMFYLGEIARSDGKLELAANFFRQVIKIDEKFTGPRFRLAQMLMWKNTTEGVLDLLKTELCLMCEDEDVLLSIGNMLIKLKEYELAMNCFLRVLESNPQRGQGYFGIAAVLIHKKDIQGSIQFLEHSIQLDIENPTAYICSAMVHCQNQDYKKARQMIYKAKAISENSWKLNIWIAKIGIYEFCGGLLKGLKTALQYVYNKDK